MVEHRTEDEKIKIAVLRAAFQAIKKMTDADDPESYRSDGREGCLDTVFAKAVWALEQIASWGTFTEDEITMNDKTDTLPSKTSAYADNLRSAITRIDNRSSWGGPMGPDRDVLIALLMELQTTPSETPQPASKERTEGPLWTPTTVVERMFRECGLSLADTFTLDIKLLEGLLYDSLLWRRERMAHRANAHETPASLTRTSKTNVGSNQCHCRACIGDHAGYGACTLPEPSAIPCWAVNPPTWHQLSLTNNCAHCEIERLHGLLSKDSTATLMPIESLLVEWWGSEMDDAELFNRAVRLSEPLAKAMSKGMMELLHRAAQETPADSKLSSDESKITLEDGKYVFFKDTEGLVYCHRYGKPWREFLGDKAVSALFDYALNLKQGESRQYVLKPLCTCHGTAHETASASGYTPNPTCPIHGSIGNE